MKIVIKVGLRWEDIVIEDSTNPNAAIGKEIDILIINIFIYYSEMGESLDILCDAQLFLTRWRRIVNEYRRETGLRPCNKKDYVFFNLYND